MSQNDVTMTLYDKPSILNVGYTVKLHSLTGQLIGYNGKVGEVKALTFDENDNGIVAVSMNDQYDKFDNFIMMVRTTNVEFLSGNGYNKFTVILQMPNNPDYIGEIIQCGQIKGGLKDGCPALVIGLDPENWESFKDDIVEHVVAYSITDKSGALNYIKLLYEEVQKWRKLNLLY